MKTKRIKIGSQVSTKISKEAYYSNYGGQPKSWFNPGMIGTLVAYTPAVRGHNRDIAIVDFIDAGLVRHVCLELNECTKDKE